MSKRTIPLKITIHVDINETDVEELEKTITHHIENFVDLDAWPEIERVYDCSIERQTEPDTAKRKGD